VAGDAVAEVDGPGKRGGSAVGIVGEAGQEAADASDGDAECEGDGIEVACGLAESDVALHEFDGDQAEGESTDDRLSSHEVGGIVKVVPGEFGIFETEEELRAESGSGHGGGDHSPTDWGRERIAEATAEGEIEAEGDEVSQRFKEDVRVDEVVTEVKVDGEMCGGEMGREEDGEL